MELKNFNFFLPEDRIARFPSPRRQDSRLMVVDRASGEISHRRFGDLPDLTGADDFFVVNNSRVIPARLFGHIDGKRVEVLIVKVTSETEAETLALPAKKFKPGVHIDIDGAPGVRAEVLETGHRGRRRLRFSCSVEQVLAAGYAPLPPYIKRKFEEAQTHRDLDLERYQTVYSGTSPGSPAESLPSSIAAPTAGLHFTPRIIERIKQQSEIIEVTLAVGETTFRKIETEDIQSHRMGREYITITEADRRRIRALKKDHNLVAVGTTSVRALETYALQQPGGETFFSELFITPGFQFRLVDKLVTNFHLPESTLFILVSAFGGLELMKEAYRIAIDRGYRFFSYGDAMLIT